MPSKTGFPKHRSDYVRASRCETSLSCSFFAHTLSTLTGNRLRLARERRELYLPAVCVLLFHRLCHPLVYYFWTVLDVLRIRST
jgi:hypothetical protein